MSLIELLIWALVIFGASNGVANSTLLYPIRFRLAYKRKKSNADGTDYEARKWLFPYKLMSCVMCMGFWLGMVAGIFWQSPTGNFICDAFLGSAVSWVIFLLIVEKQDKQ